MSKSTLLLGRAPLFDGHAHPAGYRLMTAGGSVDGLLDALLDLDVSQMTRGLPLLIPVAMRDVDRLAQSGLAPAVWAEPLEDEVDDATEAAWRAAAPKLGGVVLRDLVTSPDHERLYDIATAGRIHAEHIGVDTARDRRRPFRGLSTVATGVHTAELHGHLRAIGIELIGGRYLDDVRLETSRTAQGDRLALLELATQLQSHEPSLTHITALIERSPTLSFEVMRWVNSAFIGLKHRVDDLRRAVGLLGPGRITQVVSLLLARDFAHRPTELYRVALVRARMCEQIAESLGEPRQAYYITGLFSMLEALLETPLEQILTQLPLTDEVVRALLHHDGKVGRVLQVAKLYEHSVFDDPVVASFDPGVLSSSYLGAVVFADQILDAVQSDSEAA